MNSPEIYLTPEIVQEAKDEVCAKYRARSSSFEGFGQREFTNAVFETLVDRIGLPWKKFEGFYIPDFDNLQIKELNLQLNQFTNILAKEYSE